MFFSFSTFSLEDHLGLVISVVSGLHHPAGIPQVTAAQAHHRHNRWGCQISHHELSIQHSRQTRGSFEQCAVKSCTYLAGESPAPEGAASATG